MKIFKTILLIVLVIAMLALAAVFIFGLNDARNPYPNVTVDDAAIPAYTEINLPFEHQFNSEKSLPLVGSCLIDVDNDGVDEVFAGGGLGQNDGLFKFDGSAFIDISKQFQMPISTQASTLGAVSFDMDNNGKTDLIISRDDGLFVYLNDGEKLTAVEIQTSINDKSTPATVTLGDIDKDGLTDIFLCTYIRKELMEGQTIFNDPEYGATSALLRNTGKLKFQNITSKAGLEYIHNTFQAVFVDIEKDGWLDLVVAYDTGDVRMYKNNGDTTFTFVPNPTNGSYAYPMGIGVGDHNNDGLVDFFFSNTGTSVPKFLAKGDLEEHQSLNTDWILLENEGSFVFADVAEKVKIDKYEFSWGGVMADFNNDGKQDLVVSENYVDYPIEKIARLPGRFFIQNEQGEFAAVEKKAGLINRCYGITPLASDFNNDGALDLIFTNIDGTMRAFLNEPPAGNFLKVKFPETNAWIGSEVRVILADKSKLTDWYIIGEGLGSDQSAEIIFGIGVNESVTNVRITTPFGYTMTYNDIPANKTIYAKKEPL